MAPIPSRHCPPGNVLFGLLTSTRDGRGSLLLMSSYQIPPSLAEALEKIQRDADRYSFTRTTIYSGASVEGLGSLSGKAIQAVGAAVLSGVDNAFIRGRLRFMATRLRIATDEDARFPRSYYRSLFELQRLNVLSERVRRNAWFLILQLLDRGHVHELGEVILADRIEGELFFRRLAVLKLSNWEIDGLNRGVFIRKRNENLAALLVLVLDRRPSFIHSHLGFTQFLLLLYDGPISHAELNEADIKNQKWREKMLKDLWTTKTIFPQCTIKYIVSYWEALSLSEDSLCALKSLCAMTIPSQLHPDWKVVLGGLLRAASDDKYLMKDHISNDQLWKTIVYQVMSSYYGEADIRFIATLPLSHYRQMILRFLEYQPRLRRKPYGNPPPEHVVRFWQFILQVLETTSNMVSGIDVKTFVDLLFDDTNWECVAPLYHFYKLLCHYNIFVDTVYRGIPEPISSIFRVFMKIFLAETSSDDTLDLVRYILDHGLASFLSDRLPTSESPCQHPWHLDPRTDRIELIYRTRHVLLIMCGFILSNMNHSERTINRELYSQVIILLRDRSLEGLYTDSDYDRYIAYLLTLSVRYTIRNGDPVSLGSQYWINVLGFMLRHWNFLSESSTHDSSVTCGDEFARVILCLSPLPSDAWVNLMDLRVPDIPLIRSWRSIFQSLVTYISSLKDNPQRADSLLVDIHHMEKRSYPDSFRHNDSRNVVISLLRMISTTDLEGQEHGKLGRIFLQAGGEEILDGLSSGDYDFLSTDYGLIEDEAKRERRASHRVRACRELSTVFGQSRSVKVGGKGQSIFL